MSAPRIMLAFCHLSGKNYQYWWTFDEVLTKTNVHSFFQTRCRQTAVTSRLRSQIFPKVHTRTKRYCSFTRHGLNHYQHKTNKS